MSYLFTSESVSEGHPDKVADQISDGILDHFLAFDPGSRVAIETLVTTGQVILSGEVSSSAYIDIQNIARDIISSIGYNNLEYKFTGESCAVMSLIHEQSEDISRGVVNNIEEEQGAGDQGIMFGYACNETENAIPLTLEISNEILKELSILRKEKILDYLRPDSKSQVTIKYDDDDNPIMIDTIVISTQHDEFDKDEKKMLSVIKDDLINKLMPRVIDKFSDRIKKLFNEKIKYFINPTGKFVIGGPHGDTGLTGRKIIVDTYGGKGAHGGGAFSGKDPSKVDRSAAYATRHIAKNICAAGICDEILVQVSYAIGVAKPMGIYVNTFGSSKCNMSDIEISNLITENIGMTPYDIENRLKLRNPMYLDTASYGHMGRKPSVIKKNFTSLDGNKMSFDIETFTWEKLDMIDKIKKLIK